MKQVDEGLALLSLLRLQEYCRVHKCENCPKSLFEVCSSDDEWAISHSEVPKTLTRIAEVIYTDHYDDDSVIAIMIIENLSCREMVTKFFKSKEWEKIKVDGYYYEEYRNV